MLFRPRLTREDELVASYRCWREASESVRHAYRGWAGATRPARGLWFAAYRAALDWEEHAAAMYCERAAQRGAVPN